MSSPQAETAATKRPAKESYPQLRLSRIGKHIARVAELPTDTTKYVRADHNPQQLGQQQVKLTWHWGRCGTWLPRPRVRLRLTCRELAKPEGRPPYYLQFWIHPGTRYYFTCKEVIREVREW